MFLCCAYARRSVLYFSSPSLSPPILPPSPAFSLPPSLPLFLSPGNGSIHLRDGDTLDPFRHGPLAAELSAPGGVLGRPRGQGGVHALRARPGRRSGPHPRRHRLVQKSASLPAATSFYMDGWYLASPQCQIFFSSSLSGSGLDASKAGRRKPEGCSLAFCSGQFVLSRGVVYSRGILRRQILLHSVRDAAIVRPFFSQRAGGSYMFKCTVTRFFR